MKKLYKVCIIIQTNRYFNINDRYIYVDILAII